MSGVHQSSPSESVVLLTLDNPPANALGRIMRAEMQARFDEIEQNPQVRAVVLTGVGRAFCSGDDLKEQATARAVSSTAHLGDFARLLDRIETFRLPVIAAINGWCMGGGLELALVCDVRVASRSATFTCSGVNVGLLASAYRLPRLIGVARAKHMLFTGLPFDAKTAERFGLTAATCSSETLLADATALAVRIASRAPLSVEAVKRTTARAPDLTPEEATALIARELGPLAASADHQEALAAFGDKREPRFKGE